MKWCRGSRGVALLDGNLPKGGPVVVEILRRSGIKVVVQGGKGEPAGLRECVQASIGVVLKSSVGFDELVQTLQRLLLDSPSSESDSWSQRKPDIESRMTSRPSPFLILTPREQHTLAELMEEQTAEAIAKADWIAHPTVRSPLKSILQKLGVNSQSAAVALARQHGWTYSLSSELSQGAIKPNSMNGELSSENPMADSLLSSDRR